ncbi:MAG: hypothetical protein DWG76_06695 [Chloroflexi bacterium]|nr:hypothetical protein [Chloroflexota bacterium]
MLLVVLGLTVLTILVAQMPAVKRALGWRWDGITAYVGGLIDPVEALPAPEIVVTPALAAEAPTPSPPGPTVTARPSPTALPAAANLAAPTFELQGPNNCGPATLSLYLNYYGWEGDQYTIAEEIKPISSDRNVNVDELVYYAQNWAGWLNSQFRVDGDVELLKTFVANGIPVMIEEGYYLQAVYWPNDDRWAGHYLLVTGYDDATGEFIVQDTFDGPNLRLTYARLDEGWQQFNRVYMLAYLPDQEESVREILGENWNVEVNRQRALETARAETDADPADAYAWFNVGMNLVYFENYVQAAEAFDVARSIGLPQRMLRYQFGPFFAYYHANRLDDLNSLVDYALRITDVSEEAMIWKGWGYYRQGNNTAAIQQFRLAYETNPKSVYAQQALDFMGVSP